MKDQREKAIAYVRVSTEEQAKEGVSINAQEERIKAYCVMQNLELVKVIHDEGVSGAKPLATRPGGRELLNLLNGKGNIKHVIAYKLDRLFRDAEDALHQTRNWDKQEIALHLIDMGGQTLNTASAMGRYFLTMVAGFAELERNLIAERTALALRHKKKNRQVYGTIPLGYQQEGEYLKIDPEELLAVRMIKENRKKGLSLRQIADILDQAGIKIKKVGNGMQAR